MSKEPVKMWVYKDLLENTLSCCLAGLDNTLECLNGHKNSPMSGSSKYQRMIECYEYEIAEFKETIRGLKAILGVEE